MKASKIKAAIEKHDELQAKIDQCKSLMDDLRPKTKVEPNAEVCHLAMGGILKLRIGGIENDLGEYLFETVGTAIRKIIEGERIRLLDEQRELEV